MVFKCERGKSCVENKNNKKKINKRNIEEEICLEVKWYTYDLPIFTSVCRER
jgi:hypothetical protein